MLYYEQWEPMLSLPDKTLAQLFRTALVYSKSGTAPKLTGTAAVLWGMIQPALDRDGEHYELRCLKNRYSTYCREQKKHDEDCLDFDSWCKSQSFDIERNQSISNDIQLQLQSESQSQLQSENIIIADKPPKKSGFIPPTVAEVAAYCRERGNTVDPQKFVDHYDASGWMRGNSRVKDWKACVRTWEHNDKQGSTYNYDDYQGADSL